MGFEFPADRRFIDSKVFYNTVVFGKYPIAVEIIEERKAPPAYFIVWASGCDLEILKGFCIPFIIFRQSGRDPSGKVFFYGLDIPGYKLIIGHFLDSFSSIS